MDSAQRDVGWPDYGIDALYVVRNLALTGVAGCAVVLTAAALLPGLRWFLLWFLFSGASLLVTAGLMVWSSRVAKIRGRERLLDTIPWRGDETVLDVGCGRGLMLIGAAKRLTSGKAIGVDIWQAEDLSGNSPEATRANARAEGVADRVEIQDGDARRLPFPDAAFDVVLSCQAIHNIFNAAEREQAVREIVRALKPGGRVAIVDFQHTKQYVPILQSAGMQDIERSRSLFPQFPPSPVVTARKAE